MRFVDAHIHLSDPEYDDKIAGVVREAELAEVVALVSNSMNLETSKKSLGLSEAYEGLVYAALGIHPWNTNRLLPDELQQTVDFIQQHGTDKEKVVAIGEIGLDPQYAKRKVEKEGQVEVFHQMLRLAEKFALPVIVHSRWAAPKILDILSSYHLGGVLWHWYSGPVELLPKIVERGDFVSAGPPTVFSERIREIVRLVPIENLLTETDGPVQYYGPFKDRPTTPAFVPEVVKAMADVKKLEENVLAERVLSNFSNLFNAKP